MNNYYVRIFIDATMTDVTAKSSLFLKRKCFECKFSSPEPVCNDVPDWPMELRLFGLD